jgi:hypothetical protein
VFNKGKANILLPNRLEDYTINLRKDIVLLYKRLYPILRDELAIIKKYINKNLTKGFIRPSTLSIASLVLLIKKPRGGLRFYIDYRGLNTLIIKNRYLVLLIYNILN